MTLKIFLALGYFFYTLVRLTGWLRYRNCGYKSVKTSFSRMLLFVGIDIGIIAVMIFQLGISEIGKINLGQEYSSLIRFCGLFFFSLGIFLSCWGRLVLNGSWNTAGMSIKIGEKVVMNGPYSIMRHPIYVGAWLMGVGFELSLVNWMVLLVIGLSLVLYQQAKFEEKILQKFLPEYKVYMLKTGMFFPKISLGKIQTKECRTKRPFIG